MGNHGSTRLGAISRMKPNIHYKIAVLPGDGIGPEVTDEAVRVLRHVEEITEDLFLDLIPYPVGASAYVETGNPFPKETLEACAAADAVLLGAMGLPSVRWPDGREMTPQIDLREKLDLYGGLRPVRLYHQLDTPLRNKESGKIDLLLVRESTEGLFAARKESRRLDDAVTDTLRITRKGSERICRLAFTEAEKRRGSVTLVDKANVLPSMVFFREIFNEIARDYPSIQAECVYVDAMCLYLVRDPERFDVIVTENMFGDILSDLIAGLVGGMGMAPSGDLGEERAVFQPSHGSAPDIAGQGIANPLATILSARMMLSWLGSKPALIAAAKIDKSVEDVLSNPSNRTPDMGGSLSTFQMTDLIIQSLDK